jgi:hypothetical protein
MLHGPLGGIKDLHQKKNNFLNKHPTAGDLCGGITTTIALSV